MNNEIKNFDFTPLDGMMKVPVASVEQAYFDSQGNEVSKEEGCQARITEFDADGNVIREVWGSYTNDESFKTR